MRVIVLGSTGLVGSQIVKVLNENSVVDSIVTVGRRSPKLQSSKIDAVVEKDSNLWSDIIKKENGAQMYISAFGTTRKLAGGAENFKKIDYGINYEAAKAAKAAGVHTCVLVSTIGASALSPFLYPKCKGQLEDDIIALKFPKTVIIRPGLLLGEREVAQSWLVTGMKKMALLTKDTMFSFPAYPAEDVEVAKTAILRGLEPLKSENEVVIVEGRDVNRAAKLYAGGKAEGAQEG